MSQSHDPAGEPEPMTLQDHTRNIICLSWARILGLADDELLGTPSRHEVVQPEGSALSFLRLFGHGILSGPPEAIRRARALEDPELVQERCLLDLGRRHGPGARSLGTSRLLYAEEPPSLGAPDSGAVSFEPTHVDSVLTDSPADDVTASGIAEASWSAALVDEDTGAGLGAAGRSVWAGMLADIRVLTIPSRRGAGVGLHLAAVAAEEAFVEGLVPQWRASETSPAGLRIASRLGFTQAGTQTTVAFG
ncbi:hypothetical protein [Nesterenkonia lutea]|uniref:GNAT superfamily N-acetyltransferase n=1 Tax=Nesterenkonia lutea TaxID=272919 RepID=A0ABR9JAT0_9MICC|nr:hypothetical protein [Nesterenkonia lutea]MBE1523037.1 GNAT superfamily N-acetyltransferase [Nesterenkonia lutea]